MAVETLALPQQLVDKGQTASAPVDEQVLHLHQTSEVDPQLRQPPAGGVEQLPAAKEKITLLDVEVLTLRADPPMHEIEEPPRLRRQLVEGSPERFGGEPVRRGDVVDRRLDVVDFAGLARRPP